ncbi:MAG: DUF3806 domain-containing protein [Gammaproteobacteria bacterium]|nr:DUF3806 domain-containing protein [Gammaproteobacteria bacterium]
MRYTLIIWLLALFPLTVPSAIADEEATITPPTDIMIAYMAAQREYLKRAAATEGQWLNEDLTDLDRFQNLIDNGRFDTEDTRLMQSIGIFIGDRLNEATYGNFRWSIYEDNLGRTRALCLRDATPCVFPVTLVSRRAEGGADIDLRKLYNDTLHRLQQVTIE